MLERPMCILDRKEEFLADKSVHLVNILWLYHVLQEATWE